MKIKYFVKKHLLTPLTRSIRMKFLILTTILAIAPLVMATVRFSHHSKDVMEKEIFRQNDIKLEWVDKEFYEDSNRIKESMTAFYFDSNIKYYISKLKLSESWQAKSNAFFMTKLNAFLYANYRDFTEVQFYTFESQLVFMVSHEENFLAEDISDDELYQNPFFNQHGQMFYLQDAKGRNRLDGPYVTKIYKRFEDQSIIGALVVKLNWNLFEKAVELLDADEGNKIFFCNGEGQVIFPYVEKQYDDYQVKRIMHHVKGLDEGSRFILDDDYVFFQEVLDDLYVIKTIPVRVAHNFYLKTFQSQLDIIFITGFLIILLTLFIGVKLTKPVRSLTQSMQNVEVILKGDTIPKSIVKTHDEIKVLEQSYLFMMQKIRNLIDEEYKQRIEMQSAQLMALQAQINPHFMYNTLQMIGSMAVDKGVLEIYDVIGAFSKMLRYNMQLTEEMVTMEQELENVRHYLQIQDKRFDKKLTVHYDVDQALYSCLIPKLSIQPMVENSFKYGFKKTEQEWQIGIKVYQREEKLMVEIRDNGQGIQQDRLLQIRGDLRSETGTIFGHSENLGLKNIEARIKLYFGKEYGLCIESNQEWGTCVTMSMGMLSKERELQDVKSGDYR
ncbi:histidine kinase [Vallitalea pronyensis]|uniref:Histidine kinase n=1 Tax=Vallitalea pronyensis TaxID=1348613 RepID=A0A8J8SG99_9FIRM|nr:histidine kinase [Vallitalea pronyensis]QUI22167.1 histidine kinase [Vallitalea pronyensis]